ncbi:YcxB family protein [Gottfriedia acidiceleris]|uniref:YcxB family protein n=1 Tax=Gottfriedia acidiceleris TaxID=371036 RepID=A0ABY4JPU2_9BACI|nr:YcxB family protein [Gottfriedia acidiceleris]UPM55522.1 YcxB family protein [Gottfriedia acidiceleris]
MKYTYNYDQQDVMTFNLDLYATNRKTSQYWENLIASVINYVALLFLYAYVFGENIKENLVWIGLFTLVYFCYLPFNHRYGLKQSVKSFVNNPLNERSFGETTVSLDENGIYEITPVEETKIKWENVNEVREGAEHFYFYYLSNRCISLPKRAVNDKDEIFALLTEKSVPHHKL